MREATPRRLPAWQEPTAAPTAGTGDPRIVVASVGALRRHAGEAHPPVTTRRVRVVVREWRAPYPGWSGRLGPLPHLLRHDVVLPAGGDGPAEVGVELAEPLPLPRIVAAVLDALRPASPLPRPASADVALDGGVPGWLPLWSIAAAAPGAAPDDAPVRPYDLHLAGPGRAEPSPGSAVAGPAVLTAAPVGVTEPGGGTVVVDAAAANPTGRRRYGRGLPTGRLSVDGVGWQVDRRPDDATVVVAGRVGDPLDARQAAVLAELGVVTCAAGAAPPAAYAAVVAQLAMTGVLLHAADLPADAAALLGPELAALLGAPPPGPQADPLDREIHSVRLRRAALRRHATGFALPRVAAGAYPSLARPPAVTALLMTRRPDRVVRAVADLAAQTYPELEVVVGLHGVALPPATTALLAAQPVPVRIVPVPGEVGFGEALGEATRWTQGSLLTKVDDDDRYGAEHVWDLVLARHYSGATVVGKGAEFVHLEQRDLSVRRQMASEIYTDVVAGGTMLIGRGDLEAVGGWRPVRRSVDRALLDRVLEAGGLVYRTHGFGFLYTRHADGHTWDPGLDYFVQHALRRWTGLPPYAEFGAP